MLRQISAVFSEVFLGKRQWKNSMQVFSKRMQQFFYNFLGLDCFPRGAVEAQARDTLPADSHVQNGCISKQLRHRNNSTAVKLTTKLTPTSPSLLPKNTSI
jgi:hypothetical protein